MLTVAFGQATLTIAQIAKKVSPSVVVIQGKTDSGEIQGSGFIISKDGRIVTNLHVVKDMKTVSVRLANGEVFDSLSVLATDERRDLAIVKVAGFDLPVLELGNSDGLTVGEPMVIVGSPRGLEGTVTAGILSSVRDSGEGFRVLQTDAAVNPGNSGGPLLNTKGQAIGVVSFKLRSAEALNFAVPINYVRGLMNSLHEPLTLEQIRRSLPPQATPHEADRTSLQETLDWLREKIPFESVQHEFQSPDGLHNTITVRATTWSLESCTVTIGEETISTVKEHPALPPVIMPVRYTFTLGSINTKEVVRASDGNSYFIYFTSKSSDILRYGTEMIGVFACQRGLPEGCSHRVTMIVLESIPDEILARRVSDAFMHAASLCRDKKEPF